MSRIATTGPADAPAAAGPTDIGSRHDRGVIAGLSRLLGRRLSRRGFLARSAVVGSAVAVGGVDFVLKPQDAYGVICGPASSCTSGWTAFCCSISKGVNQCPPGSFAGGWWKADGASMCGGKARYIVDCQARCDCGCGSGTAFCGKSCWNCTPGCADDRCDQRRVCKAVFRYGQCEQGITCSGPVLCRAVSCTPPWRWADCSRSMAVDNATVAHNASCLPNWNPLTAKYQRLGSQSSALGATIGTTSTVKGGRMQRFTGGRMYYSEKTGARHLTGKVLDKYLELGETRSPLKFPVDSVRSVRGGRGARFGKGAIYVGDDGQVGALWGPLYRAWRNSGGPDSPAGLPISDTRRLTAPAGFGALCQNGSVWQADGRVARVLWGAVHEKYLSLNQRKSPLGYPTSAMAESTDSAGRAVTRVSFEGGSIVARGGAAAAIWGPIDTQWRSAGAEKSALGVPVADQAVVLPNVQQARFTGGTLTWDTVTGAVSLGPPV
jgi:hypothetical protein